MKAKLTLTLDKELIEEAKEYAETSGLTISKIIETNLRSLLDERQNQEQAADDVDGMIRLDPDYDLIGDYTNYLMDRYQ